MTIPPRKDRAEITGRKFSEKCLQALIRPTPLWGLFLAALVCAFAIWWISGTGDHIPKRWSKVNEDRETDIYNTLVNPPSVATCEPASGHCSDGPIPTPHHNWNNPQHRCLFCPRRTAPAANVARPR